MSFNDLTGKIFSRLRVVARGPSDREARWECECQCGKKILVRGSSLTTGNTKSCGCLKQEHPSNLKHGMRYTKEWRAWRDMKRRCKNPNLKNFKNYGARGITVCKKWQTDFMSFYSHVGPAPSPAHSIDRIKNSQGYKPGNVKWSTRKEQANNRRKKCVVSS